MVPNKLIQYWDKLPTPKDIEELRLTWPTHNPRIDCEIFDFEKAQQFILSEYGSEISALFSIAAIPAMQSDIFRLAYILAKGGIYVDMATRCKASIAPLLDNPKRVVLMRKWHGGICNGIVIAAKENPIILSIWEQVLDNIQNRRYDNVWKATGPFLYNITVKKEEDENNYSIYPQEQLTQYFELVNDLEHKKKAHWSDVQKNQNIYLD
jgi:mannosyltransferase OCH1-like enzyme